MPLCDCIILLGAKVKAMSFFYPFTFYIRYFQTNSLNLAESLQETYIYTQKQKTNKDIDSTNLDMCQTNSFIAHT